MSVPLWSGNPDIAYRFLNGPANVYVVGDSIYGPGNHSQDKMMDCMLRVFDFNRIVGVGGPHVYGGIFYSDTSVVPATCTHTLYDGFDGSQVPNSLPYWNIAKSGAQVAYGLFTGATIGADSTVHANQIAAFWDQCDAVYHKYYKWFSGVDLRCTHLAVANSKGCQSYRLHARNRFGNALYAQTNGLSARAATPAIVASTVDVAATTYTGASDEPVFMIKPTVGTTPAANDNMIHAGWMISAQGVTGTKLFWHGVGGVKALDWADDAKLDPTLFTQIVQALGTDIVYIALGQNDGGRTKAQYKANLTSIKARFLLGNPNMCFIFVPPYQTATAGWENNSAESFSDAAYELGRENPNCLFLNQWALLGKGTAAEKYTYMDSKVLGDHVHPLYPSGAYQIMSQVHTLLQMAIAARRHTAYSIASGSVLKASNRRG